MTLAVPSQVVPTLSVIVPTYRDGANIYDNLRRIDRALEAAGETYEIIAVSDGNVDNTVEEARRLNVPHARVYHYPRNMGKGFALRYGVARSRGEIVTFIDGDGDIDPGQIAVYLRLMRDNQADVVIGSKRHPDSEVVYPPMRRLYSSIYQALLGYLFRLDVRDTQVGLKLFRRDVLVGALPRIVVKRYAFDLELLVVAGHLGFTRIVEAPVRIGQRFSSTINRRAILSILLETAAIYYRKNVLHYYDRPHASVEALDVAPDWSDHVPVSSSAERWQIAYNMALWAGRGGARMAQRCFGGARARLDQALGVRAAFDGDRTD